MKLQKAQRKKVKLRLNLSAPSGAGKTMSALRMAYGLTGDWTKIAVVDTENGSASLYSHLGEFNTIDLNQTQPEKYIEALNVCAKAGMECVIIDSTSHEWETLLEENELLAQSRFRGNTWAAWSQTTPRHDRFVKSVLQAPFHVITCTRSKTETIITENKKVKKIGMKDRQREGWEYELTVSLEIDRDTHFATASKDRTGLFTNAQPFLITEETGKEIMKWCNTEAKEKTAEEKLNESTTLAELANVYNGLSLEEKKRTEELKDELKTKFQNE